MPFFCRQRFDVDALVCMVGVGVAVWAVPLGGFVGVLGGVSREMGDCCCGCW